MGRSGGFGLGGRRKYPLNHLLKLSEVGVLEFFSEKVVGVFGTRGDSHPYTLTLEYCAVYLPHVARSS